MQDHCVTVQEIAKRWYLFAFSEQNADTLDAVVKRVSAQTPSSQRDRCILLLSAANGDALSREDWAKLSGQTDELFPGTPALPLWTEARLPLREALTRVIANPMTAIQDIGANAATILNFGVVVVPELHLDGGGKWAVRERFACRSVGDAIIYALALLLDPNLPHGRALRSCNYAECRRFAMPPRTGTRAKYYCSDEHRHAERNRQALERVKAMREGISVNRYRRNIQRTERGGPR